MTKTGRIDRGNGHSYKLDGNTTPGVTTIIGDGMPKPALIGWTAKSIAEYVGERIGKNGDATELINDLKALDADKVARDKDHRYKAKFPASGEFSRTAVIDLLKTVQFEDRDKAANRGTEVHNLAEDLMNGKEVEVPDELAGHVDAFIAWHDMWKPTNALPEFVCGNRRRKYMGTGDLIADLADRQRWLIDYKTNRTGPFAEVALQLAAYRYAEFLVTPDGEIPMPSVDRCGVLWLRADGYDFYEVKADEDTFRTFLYVQQVAAFQKADRSLYISESLTLKDQAA